MRARSAILDLKQASKPGLYYNACINRTAWFRRQSPVRTIYTPSRREHEFLDFALSKI